MQPRITPTRLSGLAALLICAELLICSGATAEDKIKIGVSTTLTGPAATYGDDIKNVTLFANARLGQDRFELVVEDDKCNGKDAVTVAKKLVEVDHVRGVIGFGCSGALLAAAPVYERAKIPVIGTESSAAKISEAGDYIFRTQPSDGDGVKVLYGYLVSRHKRFGMLSQETEFCEGLAQGLAAADAEKKIGIVAESFQNGDADVKPQLLRLKSKNIDGLFLNGQDENAVYGLLRKAKEIGLNVPYYAFYTGASATFLDLAKQDAEGMVVVDVPAFDAIANADGKRLFEEYTAQYGKMKAWDYGFATVFEGFRALSASLTSGEDAREHLAKTKFDGIFGTFSFDQAGDISGLSLVLKRIENRKPVLISAN